MRQKLICFLVLPFLAMAPLGCGNSNGGLGGGTSQNRGSLSQSITLINGSGNPLSNATLWTPGSTVSLSHINPNGGPDQNAGLFLAFTDPNNGAQCANPPQGFSKVACTNGQGQVVWNCNFGDSEKVNVFYNNQNLNSMTFTCSGQSFTTNPTINNTNSSPTPTPSPNPKMVIFQAPKHDGNFGGRSGLDTHCQNNKPSGLTHANTRALISVSTTDEIRDMPSNYSVPTSKPIEGTNGVSIANNWADLLDGSIANTLQAAGFTFVTNISDFHWANSNGDGSFFTGAGNACLGFTSANSLNEGGIGSPVLTDTGWVLGLAAGSSIADNCNLQKYVMCLAFDP